MSVVFRTAGVRGDVTADRVPGCREFELAISIGWLRAVAEQTLEDELLKTEGGKVIKNRFRPFGVVRSLPCSLECF